MPTLENIFPENIRLDGDTQPRAQINQATCKEYGMQMKAGKRFPPVDVFFDGEDYWLADGFHRIRAYVMVVPGEAIECNVYQGSLQDAQWHSYSVNKAHGLPRSNEDKVRAVKLALTHPMAADKSNVDIAEHCGVDEKTVRKYRPKCSTSEIPKSDAARVTSEVPKSRLRKGRDGRIINTAKIGKHSAKKRPRKTTSSCVRISPDAAIPVLGHSLPNPMISLNLPPTNPAIAAATIFKLFDTHFVRTLVAELTQRLKGIEQ